MTGNSFLDEVLTAMIEAGGHPVIVGGWVRDRALGIDSKDIDIEVFGWDVHTLEEFLWWHGDVDEVGKSFGVLRLHGLDVDFSIPRRDSKSGTGHRGFDIEVDGTMTIEEAASRRDFTINTLALDVETGEIVDVFGGLEDLQAHVLRHTSDQFGEDPLRVLRGFQFCARFDLDATEDTLAVCHELAAEADTLAIERVWEEWHKWATRGTILSAGLIFLRQAGWLPSALGNLFGLRQDREWHPEGSAWLHTLHTVDAAHAIAERDGLTGEDREALIFAALLHDVGKAVTTEEVDGHIVSPGHPQAGVEIAETFLQEIGAPRHLIARVLPLIAEHMAHVSNAPTARSVRRLARRLAPATVQELGRVIEADHSARPPLPGGLPDQAAAMVELAEALAVVDQAPTPLVMGRHLLELGWTPGEHVGEALRAAFEAQLDGEFETAEDGTAWVADRWPPR